VYRTSSYLYPVTSHYLQCQPRSPLKNRFPGTGMREVNEEFLAARNRFQGSSSLNKNNKVNEISMNTVVKTGTISSSLSHKPEKLSSPLMSSSSSQRMNKFMKEEATNIRSKSAPRVTGSTHFTPVSHGGSLASNRGSVSSCSTKSEVKHVKSPSSSFQDRLVRDKAESFSRRVELSVGKSRSAPTSPAPQDVAKYRHCDSPKSVSSIKSANGNALRLNIELWESLNGKTDVTVDAIKSTNGYHPWARSRLAKQSFDESSHGSSKDANGTSKKQNERLSLMDSASTTTPSVVNIPVVKKSSTTSPISKFANARIISSRERFVGKGHAAGLPDWNDMKQSCKNESNSSSKTSSLEKKSVEQINDEHLFQVIRPESTSFASEKIQERVDANDTSFVSHSSMSSLGETLASEKLLSQQTNPVANSTSSQANIHTTLISPNDGNNRKIAETQSHSSIGNTSFDSKERTIGTDKSSLSRESKAVGNCAKFATVPLDDSIYTRDTSSLISRETQGRFGSSRGKDIMTTPLPDWTVIVKSAKQGKSEKPVHDVHSNVAASSNSVSRPTTPKPNDIIDSSFNDFKITKKSNDFNVDFDPFDRIEWSCNQINPTNLVDVFSMSPLMRNSDQGIFPKSIEATFTPAKSQDVFTVPLPSKIRDTAHSVNVFSIPTLTMNVDRPVSPKSIETAFNPAKSQDILAIPLPCKSKETINEKYKTGGVNILYEDMSLTKRNETNDCEKLMKEIEKLRHALKVSEFRREAAEKLFLLQDKERSILNQESKTTTELGATILNLSNLSNTSDTTPSLHESPSSSYDVDQGFTRHDRRQKSMSSERKFAKNKTFFRRSNKGFMMSGSTHRRTLFDFLFGCR